MKKIFLLIALLLVCFWQINVKADDETKEIITTDPEVAEIEEEKKEQVEEQEKVPEQVEEQKQEEQKEIVPEKETVKDEKKEVLEVKEEVKAAPTRGDAKGDDEGGSEVELDPEAEERAHNTDKDEHQKCYYIINEYNNKEIGMNCTPEGTSNNKLFRGESYLKPFSSGGDLYTFKGYYDEDGNLLEESTSIRIPNSGPNGKCEIHYIYAKWDVQAAPRIFFKYTDSVSTGTGSWSNTNGSTASYTHTFRKPNEPPHYKFLYWKLDGDEYNDGDPYTFTFDGMDYGEVKNMEALAYWQADVTLNLYDDKDLLSSESSFESVSVGEDPKKDGYKFLGWVDENDNPVTDTTFYPNDKGTKPEPKEINLYASWEKVINITITKKWADDDNPDRPSSVTVKLIKDDEDYEEVELTEENWSYTFEEMPVNNEDGNEIVYSVEETNIPEGYVPAYEMEETDEGLVFTVHNVLGQGDGEPDKPNNPQTGDNIILYLITFVVSSTGLVILKRKYNFDE